MYPSCCFSRLTRVLFMIISGQNQVVNKILLYLKHLSHMCIACVALESLKLHKRIATIENTRGDKRKERPVERIFMRRLMSRKTLFNFFSAMRCFCSISFEAILIVLSAHLLQVGQSLAGLYFQLPSNTTETFVELCHLCLVNVLQSEN